MISSSNTLKKILWTKMYIALNFSLILSTLIWAPKAYSFGVCSKTQNKKEDLVSNYLLRTIRETCVSQMKQMSHL